MPSSDSFPTLTAIDRKEIADSVNQELTNGYSEVLKKWVLASVSGENPTVFRIRLTMEFGTKFVHRVDQTLRNACEKNNIPQEHLINILAERFGMTIVEQGFAG